MSGKARKQSKFFRVAREGATSDGRKIERKWLKEMAESYNRETYGARIFAEHIRPIAPDSVSGFRCYGDVIALKTEEEDGKLVLFAQIDPTPEMIDLVGRRQKVYSSIEVAENFADSGRAYMVGLGITDSPASLGTDVLAFAAQNPAANPFASRKQAPGNVIVAAEESEIEFEDAGVESASLLDRVRAMFSRRQASDTQAFADVRAAVEEVAGQTGRQGDEIDALRAEFGTLKTETTQAVSDLRGRIDHTPAPHPVRPESTGTNGTVQTDC